MISEISWLAVGDTVGHGEEKVWGGWGDGDERTGTAIYYAGWRLRTETSRISVPCQPLCIFGDYISLCLTFISYLVICLLVFIWLSGIYKVYICPRITAMYIRLTIYYICGRKQPGSSELRRNFTTALGLLCAKRANCIPFSHICISSKYLV